MIASYLGSFLYEKEPRYEANRRMSLGPVWLSHPEGMECNPQQLFHIFVLGTHPFVHHKTRQVAATAHCFGIHCVSISVYIVFI